MKTLKQHIYEALKINSKSKVIRTDHKYFPETKDELREIINERIIYEGNKCDLNDIDVSNITDKLDLVSNFAGIVLLGSMVELPIDTLDKIINVNLLATYKINNIFFPLVENGDGRIINISSEYGVIGALPFHGYYAITKHAVEVYNDSLRRELAASNVKVVCIRPGAFKTNMQSGITNQFDKMVEETTRYKEPLTKMQFIMQNELVKAKDPKYFVRIYLKALNSKKPKRYYNVNNSFKMKLYTILPEGLKDLFFKMFLK